MGRKKQVTKEYILEKSFELLRREGCESITIGRVARELGISTQPISWRFGGMDGLRSALLLKATAYMNQTITKDLRKSGQKMNPSAALATVGKRSVDFVYDEPNLSEFIRFTKGEKSEETMIPKYIELRKAIANEYAEYNVTENMAASFIRDCIIYTQGLSTLIFNGAIAGNRRSFHKMQEEFGLARLISLGIPREVVEDHLGTDKR
ncbi:MAG: TetR/AcrR family transcriptional regulator [Lachnospiraceae bacterium]|nr:TetR/AcrR family transcriptional regulator [Lachnospiraceae bacterium]